MFAWVGVSKLLFLTTHTGQAAVGVVIQPIIYFAAFIFQ